MKRFVDKYNEVWEREPYHPTRMYVTRVSDGNIGGWFNGKGLTPTPLADSNPIKI